MVTSLSRFEAARLLGVRAMQLSEGSPPRVSVDDPDLAIDHIYVAARELCDGAMDACVLRDGALVHVASFPVPQDVVSMVNTRDGGSRPMR